MGLLVIHPGLSTTVQDLGRPGYRAWGVSPCGAFDRGSAGLANALLGNPPSDAVIELTLAGGTYLAEAPLALALAGATLEASVKVRDGAETRIEAPTAFPLAEGDRMVLGGMSRGARAYLAVRGGWQTPLVLGSRSSETRLKAGDRVPCFPGSTPIRHVESPAKPSSDDVFRVIDGPDSHCLDPECLSAERIYRVSKQGDRMGLRLDGPSWPILADPERTSTPVAPGALQCAGGRPLLLGVACGTMGGYPHVAHVISADLDRVGQLRFGDELRFERVSLAEARRLDSAYRLERDALFKRIATLASDRPDRTWPGV